VPTAKLPPEEGEHAVFAQFRNGPGRKSPVYSDSIDVDRTPPIVSSLAVSLREGALGGGPASIPVSVTWAATDAVSGLSDATIAVSCGDRPTERSEAPGSAAPGELATWAGEALLASDATCAVTAIGRDGAGNNERLTERGLTTRYAAGDRADVSGDQVGVVARRGPDAGRAAVLLDGEALGLVDLYAAVPGGPELVYVADLPGGSHSVELAGTGGADPASTGTAVDVEGFVTLAR
jgi:hypothetical protein